MKPTIIAISLAACHGLQLRPALRHTKPPMSARAGGIVALNPVAAYSAALVAAPMATNVGTAAVISFTGDAIAQKLVPEKKTWDWARLAWITLTWGPLVNGYLLGKWFGILGGWFPDARTSVTSFVLKLATNQAVLAPSLNAGFFAFVILTRSKPIARITASKWAEWVNKCKADLFATVMQSNVYWSCVQTLNFRVFPDSLTVISTNVFFLFWTVYLCVVGNRKVPKT